IPDLDVSLVAQSSQPQLGFLVYLAFAQGGQHALAAQLVTLVVRAPAQELNDMPSELGAEWLADLVLPEPGKGALELPGEGAGHVPVEVAAAARSPRVLRSDARERAEVLAREDARADRLEALARRRIVLHIVRAHTDLTRGD